MKRKLDENDVPSEVPLSKREATRSFEALNLDPRLLQAVTKEKYSEPTLVQAEAIPLALEGKDILGQFPQSFHHRLKLTDFSSSSDRVW